MINLQTMSILVVDDMKSMRLTIRKMLRNLEIGKMLRFADNGKRGLEVLKASPCDLVIIDWNMPVMNGSQMLDKLRQDKALRDIPVIMVTAENEREIVSEVAEHEIDAYLLKPLTLAALDNKIKSVVENVNNPDQATCHVLKARECEEAGNITEAIEEIRLALVHKPSASRILRKLGLLHLKIGKTVIGVKCLQKAISVNKQDAFSRDILAQIFIKQKEYRKAVKIYLEILGLSNRYFVKATDLGETLMEEGYRAEAMRLFSTVISKARKHNTLKDRIIDICLENHEHTFVLTVMEKALQENPSNHDLMYKAGLLYMENGNSEKAMSFFRTVDTGRKGDIDAKLQIARIFQSNGEILKADDFVSQALRLDPTNKEALELRQML